MNSSEQIRVILEEMISGPHDLSAAQWSGHADAGQGGVLLEYRRVSESGGWDNLPAPPKAAKVIAAPQIILMADPEATPALLFAGKSSSLLLSGEEATLLSVAAAAWQAGENALLRLTLMNKKASGPRFARLSLFTPDWTQRRITCTPDRAGNRLIFDVHEEDLNADDGRWRRVSTWRLPLSSLPDVQKQAEVLRVMHQARLLSGAGGE